MLFFKEMGRVFISVLILVFFAGLGYAYSTNRIPFLLLSKEATLLVTSDPDGKEVFIDGEKVGRTPYRSANLSSGEPVLTVAGVSKKVTLTAGALTFANFVLGPSDNFSSTEVVWLTPAYWNSEAVIISDPPAQIHIDGQPVGVSPLTTDVGFADHTVMASKTGYISRSLKVNPKKGFSLNVSFSLPVNPLGETRDLESDLKFKLIYPSTELSGVDDNEHLNGLLFWLNRAEELKEVAFDYILTSKGVLFEKDGEEVQADNISIENRDITVLYLSGEKISSEASSTLSKMGNKLYPPPPMVEILPTPTGWLRVRSGPGTSYSEIAKVKPGEKYELLGEQGGWYKIKLEDGSEGWVSSQYSKKL